MTPEQWARVFDAGAVRVQESRRAPQFMRGSPTPASDVGALLVDALFAMAGEARKISKETR